MVLKRLVIPSVGVSVQGQGDRDVKHSKAKDVTFLYNIHISQRGNTAVSICHLEIG